MSTPENNTAELTINNTTGPQEHVHVDESVINKISKLVLSASAIQQQGNSFHLLVPEGCAHKDITDIVEKTSQHPSRKRGTVELSDIESFNAYVKTQGIPAKTVIYADPEKLTFTVIFNDHEEADAEGSIAGWRDFRAVYQASLSREFANWQRNDKKPMEQEDFAIFLEDNIADVIEPSGDALLKIALTLQAKIDVNFSSSRRLDNGQVQLTFTETIDARAGDGSIEIPREFAIGCRLFKNGAGFKLKARLKYRLNGGKVKFWYELDRAENALEEVFKEYTAVVSGNGFPVLLGKPGA